MMKQVIFSFLLIIASVSSVIAQTCTAQADGDWDDAATWDCGIVPDGTIPNIVIPAGITVTIPAFTTVNYDGQVSVYGTLTILLFSNLNMAAGSSVDLITGGTVNGIFGSNIIVGGISTPINFGNTVTGPSTVDENGSGPLPITLILFEARCAEPNVNLNWATASEENFDYFSLERSEDGIDFKEIAQIQGVGNSFERVDYEFSDEFPLIGRSYYRLRSIDFDGYTEIFDYVMVEIEGAGNDFSVYPNPIQDGQFSLQTNFTNEAQLIIYNNVGKVEEQLNINDWMSDYVINLQPGSYLFKVVTNDGVIVKRVLVK